MNQVKECIEISGERERGGGGEKTDGSIKEQLTNSKKHKIAIPSIFKYR